MKSKKTFLWIISIVSLLSITGILYVYYLFNKTSHLPEHIPANASLVVYVNTQVLIKNSLSKGPDTGQWRSLKLALQNSPYFKGIDDPRDLGIDVFSGVALVDVYNLMYALIPLNDAKKLADYLARRQSEFPHLRKNFDSDNILLFQMYSTSGNEVSIAFNDKYVIIFQDKNDISDMIITSILNVKEKQSFKYSKQYELAHNDTAGIWFYADKKYVKAKTDLKGRVYLGRSITIEGSDIASNSEFPRDVKDIVTPANTLYTAISGDTDNPLNNYIRRLGFLCGLGADDDNFELFDFKNHRNLLYMVGPKAISTKHIHYEYDDNFNKREVISLETDTIEACAMLYEGRRKGYFKNFNEVDTNLMKQFDNSIGTYVTMDETIFKYIAPVPVKFKLKAWQRNIQSIGYYYFNLEIKSLPQWQF